MSCAEWAEAYAKDTAPQSDHNLELHIMVNDIGRMSSGVTALELGCGTCANYPMFRENKMAYFGIDCSEIPLRVGVTRFPELDGKVMAGDFTTMELPVGAQLICDRAAIAHNDSEAIAHCVNQIYRVLPARGMFVGVDWFSLNHSEATRGERVDGRTRTAYEDGQFAGIGCVNFSSREDLEHLFKDFDIALLRERIRKTPVPYNASPYINFPYISKHFRDREYQTAVWDIFAVKRK